MALGPGGWDAASPNRWGNSTSQPSTLRASTMPAPGPGGQPVSQLKLAHTDRSGDPRGPLPCPARSSTILSHTLGAQRSGLCSVNGPGPGGRPDAWRTGLFPNPNLGHGPGGSHLGDEGGCLPRGDILSASGACAFCLDKLLPSFVSRELQLGLRSFERKLQGFSSDSAVLCGVETRTSAPVRILRTEGMNAVGHKNIYPCGEGAGYAGGITSAAVDGIRVAQNIMKRFSPFKD